MILIVTCPLCAEDIPAEARLCPYCVSPRTRADAEQAIAREASPHWDGTCGYCAETIPEDAFACPYCASLTPAGKLSGHQEPVGAAPNPGQEPAPEEPRSLPVPTGYSVPRWHRYVAISPAGMLMSRRATPGSQVMYREEEGYWACAPSGAPVAVAGEQVRSRWLLGDCVIEGMFVNDRNGLSLDVVIRGKLRVLLTGSHVRCTVLEVTHARHLDRLVTPAETDAVYVFIMPLTEINVVHSSRKQVTLSSLAGRTPTERVTSKAAYRADESWTPQPTSDLAGFSTALFQAMLDARLRTGDPEQRKVAERMSRKPWQRKLQGIMPVEITVP